MSIFKKDSEELNINKKTEFEKIGVNVIKPFKRLNEWFFIYNNIEYPMAPAQIVSGTLSPIILGTNNYISSVCEIKQIKNHENGFNLLFSTEYFPTCDVKLTYKDHFYDGYIYSVEPLNFLNVLPGQSIFICSFVNFYYNSLPKELYVKAEAIQAE